MAGGNAQGGPSLIAFPQNINKPKPPVFHSGITPMPFEWPRRSPLSERRGNNPAFRELDQRLETGGTHELPAL